MALCRRSPKEKKSKEGGQSNKKDELRFQFWARLRLRQEHALAGGAHRRLLRCDGASSITSITNELSEMTQGAREWEFAAGVCPPPTWRVCPESSNHSRVTALVMVMMLRS